MPQSVNKLFKNIPEILHKRFNSGSVNLFLCKYELKFVEKEE